MTVLLDTSVFIRLGSGQAPVSNRIRQAIVEADSVLVSPISRTEIGIKLSIGKLRLPAPEAEFWTEVTHRLQATELTYNWSHAALLSTMKLVHRDPFDRMLAAQCIVEDVWLATTDPIFARYLDKVIS